MSPQFLSIALFTLYLPHLIAASQCQTCDSFNAALKSCQTTGTNSTAIGSKMDTETVHCMCVSSSSSTEMADCAYCNQEVSAGGVVVDGYVLAAWMLALGLTKWWVRLVLQPDLQRKLHLQLQPYLQELPNLPKQAQRRPYLPGHLVYFRRSLLDSACFLRPSDGTGVIARTLTVGDVI